MTPEDSLESLRNIVNTGTIVLAASRMLDSEVSRGIAWALKTQASQVHQSFQLGRSIMVDGEGSNRLNFIEEKVDVPPLLLEGAVCKVFNPLIFSSPFVVGPVKGKASETEFQLICAVATFNLGLAAHAQSFVCNEKKRQSLLCQARNFYIQGNDLLEEIGILPPDGAWIQVFLAICNNLAEVCAELGEYDVVEDCQRTFHEYFWTIVSSRTSRVYRHFHNVCRHYSHDVPPIS